MIENKSVIILVCWYGRYPWYFSYFVHSCFYNPSIQFAIITDNTDLIPNQPDNMTVIYKTLGEIQEIASTSLSFSSNITTPYKLCDFKPAYGFLFPEIINGYDFWGHSDIDIVYGDIRKFITTNILDNYDVVSSRHDYITGSFCLYRNRENINTLFKESKDYEKVFSSERNFCFDECNYLFAELQNGASVFDFPDHIQSMTYVVHKATKEGRLNAFFDFMIIEGTPGKIKWEKGKLTYKNEFEVMFYHLIKFKTACKRPKILNPVPDTFYFTPRKIMTTTKFEVPAL